MEQSTAARGPSLADVLSSEVAFRAWYDRALPRVFGYVLRRCGSSDLAEDVTQQAFVEAVRRPDHFRGEADPVTWLCAIARNKLADHFRREERDARRRLRVVVTEIAPHGDQGVWDRRSRQQAIEEAIRTLPPLQRGAFVFRYLDDLSVREVARLIGKSEKATESLLARARDNFRRAYGEASDE
jgi:RNA polymerase sigma-70 factor (ECF subfamily)